MTKNAIMISAMAAMLMVGGCAKKAPKDLPPPPTCCGPSEEIGDGGVRGDFLSKVLSDRIFFGFDQFAVDAEDMAVLQSQAAWLVRNPGVRITLEGHADERGTRDYNIALGERRANAAKNYLATLGVDPGRIDVVSYGKERPEAIGSDEAAYAKNRRAVTVVIENQ